MKGLDSRQRRTGAAIVLAVTLVMAACSTPPAEKTSVPQSSDSQTAGGDLKTFNKNELPKGAKVTDSGKVLNKQGEVIGVVQGSEAAEKVKERQQGGAKVARGNNSGKGKQGGGNVAADSYRGEIGITKDSATIGFLFPRGGPYQAIFRNFDEAVQAAFNGINEAGGIHGRKLEPVFADDGYNNASAALSAAKGMRDEVFGMSTVVFNAFAAVHQYLNDNQVPFIYGNADRAAAVQLRYGFPFTTFLQTQAEMLPNFMIDKFDADSKKIGILYQDTPDLKPAVKSFQKAAAKTGLDVVITQQVAEAPSQCVNEVGKLQAAGAEVVWLAVGPLPAACALRDANSMGYKPIWTGTGNTYQTRVTNQASGCNNNGMVTMGAWRTIDSPEGQRYQAAVRKYYPNNRDAPSDDLAYLGWGLAHMWAEGLRLAGPNPTRESLVLGVETMSGWDGGMFAPRTFGRGIGMANRLGSNRVITVKVVDCEWVTIDKKWRAY